MLPDLVREVTTLAARKEYAAAARVAASGAAREDLDHAARGLLGGLAARNFKLAYETGGDLNNLCELRAVMRLVAPLDAAETGALKLAAAEEAEAELHRVAGDDWQQVCDPLLAPTHTREPATVETATRTTATNAPTPQPPPEPRAALDRRRVRTGVGTFAGATGAVASNLGQFRRSCQCCSSCSMGRFCDCGGQARPSRSFEAKLPQNVNG